jgi:hypothetical protein
MGSDEVKQLTNNIINKYVDTKGVGKITELLNASGNEGSNIISQNIVKNLFDSVGEDPNFNYGNAAKKLQGYITKYDGILSKPAIDSLKGANNILKESESVLQKSSINGFTAHIVGGAIGGTIGNKISNGSEGATIAGSVAGMVGGPIVLNMTKSLLASPQGQDILRGLSNPGPKMKAVQDIIKSMGIMGISKTLNNGSQQ